VKVEKENFDVLGEIIGSGSIHANNDFSADKRLLLDIRKIVSYSDSYDFF